LANSPDRSFRGPNGMEAIMPTISPSAVAAASRELDRRGWVRFACELRGDCQPITQLEAGNRWPAQVLDISSGGVGLLLSRRFEPGALLALELGTNETETACLPLARVCRVRREGGYWLLGCAWADELPSEDLKALISTSAVRDALWRKVRQTLGVVDGLLTRRKSRSLRASLTDLELPPVAPPPPQAQPASLWPLANTMLQWLGLLVAWTRCRPA